MRRIDRETVLRMWREIEAAGRRPTSTEIARAMGYSGGSVRNVIAALRRGGCIADRAPAQRKKDADGLTPLMRRVRDAILSQPGVALTPIVLARQTGERHYSVWYAWRRLAERGIVPLYARRVEARADEESGCAEPDWALRDQMREAYRRRGEWGAERAERDADERRRRRELALCRGMTPREACDVMRRRQRATIRRRRRALAMMA